MTHKKIEYNLCETRPKNETGCLNLQLIVKERPQKNYYFGF